MDHLHHTNVDYLWHTNYVTAQWLKMVDLGVHLSHQITGARGNKTLDSYH